MTKFKKLSIAIILALALVLTLGTAAVSTTKAFAAVDSDETFSVATEAELHTLFNSLDGKYGTKTISLTQDIDLQAPLSVSKAEIVMDMQDHTIKTSVANSIFLQDRWGQYNFTLKNGTLIMETEGGIAIKATSGTKFAAQFITLRVNAANAVGAYTKNQINFENSTITDGADNVLLLQGTDEGSDDYAPSIGLISSSVTVNNPNSKAITMDGLSVFVKESIIRSEVSKQLIFMKEGEIEVLKSEIYSGTAKAIKQDSNNRRPVTITSGTVQGPSPAIDGHNVEVYGGTISSINSRMITADKFGLVPVSRMKIKIPNVSSPSYVTALTLPEGVAYNLEKMKTNDKGEIFVWLPLAQDGKSCEVTVNGKTDTVTIEKTETNFEPEDFDDEDIGGSGGSGSGGSGSHGGSGGSGNVAGAVIGGIFGTIFGLFLILIVLYILWKESILKGEIANKLIRWMDPLAVKVCKVFCKEDKLFTVQGTKTEQEEAAEQLTEEAVPTEEEKLSEQKNKDDKSDK